MKSNHSAKRQRFSKECATDRSYSHPPIPFDRIWEQDLSVIEDQLYTDKALTDVDYRTALEYVIEAKKESV